MTITRNLTRVAVLQPARCHVTPDLPWFRSPATDLARRWKRWRFNSAGKDRPIVRSVWITLILFSVSFIVGCRPSLTRAINYRRQPCAPNSRCNHTIIEGFVERLTRGHAVIRVCPAALAASKKLTGGNSHLFYMPPNEIEARATVKCLARIRK